MTEAETTPGMFPDKPGECPEATWEHLAVWERIKEALYSLPSSFKMEGHFPARPASDLHSANTLLGEAIAKEEALLDTRDLAEVLRDVLTYGLRPEVVKEAEKVLARVEGR